MRNLVILASLFLVTSVSYGQEEYPVIYTNEGAIKAPSFSIDNNNVRNRVGRLDNSYVEFESKRYLSTNKELFGIKEEGRAFADNFEQASISDWEKVISVKLKQRIDDLSVIGGEVILTYDAQNGNLRSVNSGVVPTKLYQNLDRFGIKSDDEALKDARDYVEVQYNALGSQDPQKELLKNILNSFPKSFGFELKYFVDEGRAYLVKELQPILASDEITPISFLVNAKYDEPKVLRANLDANNLINIYDGTTGTNIIPIPTDLYKLFSIKVVVDGKPTLIGQIPNEAAQDGYKNILASRDYYKEKFGRNSFDGKDHTIDVIVNVSRLNMFGFMRANAAWVGGKNKFFAFGAGGNGFKNMSKSLNVVGHEYTHAVIEHTSNLIYERQSGAANESFADVLSVFIEGAKKAGKKYDFCIGESIIDKSFKNEKINLSDVECMRNMEHPNEKVFPGQDQPETVDAYLAKYGSCVPSFTNDNCGVHAGNAVLNKAAYNVIMNLKNLYGDKDVAWDLAERILYRTMTEKIRSTSNFLDVKNQAVEACKDIMGGVINRWLVCDAVKEAYETVGI